MDTTTEEAIDPKIDSFIFRSNLLYLMRVKGINSEVELAAALGIDPHRVLWWVKGQCFPKHAMMIRLMQFFEQDNYIQLLTKCLNEEGT